VYAKREGEALSAVSVILGSDSDREVFNSLSAVLNELDISFEQRIISAHRTPDILKNYIEDAEKRDVSVFIAIAGMAAALPGAIASITTRPVIGVPVALKSKIMGLDSLLSMVQMPPGIPVATVGLDAGRNAALLAAEILALSNETLEKKLKAYRDTQRNKVMEKDAAFKEE
jgi:5-(carboxyamino)imidazole ribonucleotide mutase